MEYLQFDHDSSSISDEYIVFIIVTYVYNITIGINRGHDT